MITCEQHTKCALILAKQGSRPFQRLSLNLIREICLYLGYELLLPSITSVYLSLFTVTGRLLLQTKLSVSFSPESCFCLAETTFLYALKSNSRAGYQIDLNSQLVWRISSMINERNCASAVYCDKEMYVFGGMISYECEKYHTQRTFWTRIAATRYSYMRPGTCLFRKEIYLSGGNRANGDIEVYHMTEDGYTVMSGLGTYYLDRAVMLVTESEFVWLSSGKIVHWSRNQCPEVRVKNKAFARKEAPWGKIQVRWAQRLYWVRNGRVLCYDARTDAVETYSRLKAN